MVIVVFTAFSIALNTCQLDTFTQTYRDRQTDRRTDRQTDRQTDTSATVNNITVRSEFVLMNFDFFSLQFYADFDIGEKEKDKLFSLLSSQYLVYNITCQKNSLKCGYAKKSN